MTSRWKVLAIAVLVALSSRAAADPVAPAPSVPVEDAPPGTYLHLVRGGHLTTPGGADLTLPPGYYLDEASWGRVDGEVRRLQDAETRLTAENDSMRGSLKGGGWKPPWWALVSVAAAGFAAGFEYARHH